VGEKRGGTEPVIGKGKRKEKTSRRTACAKKETISDEDLNGRIMGRDRENNGLGRPDNTLRGPMVGRDKIQMWRKTTRNRG